MTAQDQAARLMDAQDRAYQAQQAQYARMSWVSRLLWTLFN